MRMLVLALATAVALGGCAAPNTTVRTVDTRPSIALQGAQRNTVLVVDGRPIGEASAYDGNPLVLRIEPGTHEIEIHDMAGQVLFRQTVFVESELKTIVVH